ncbi:hypothetical protein OG625_08360 [Streptomyces sp. NBC_01351]|uniref:hypothetical protein n=1 Tax=Streptomyces sp. NBC_01351 TaxID=2903833 RepID=UPI002E2F3B3E|nr:hypothetical protein [Streptomyces sp. NBC_01351]
MRRTAVRLGHHRGVSVAAVTMATCLLAGCSDGGGGAAKGEPELGPVASNPATASLAFPMDAYTDSEADSRRMEHVQDRMISECMARYGFQYVGPRSYSGPTPSANAEDRHRYRYGTADPAHAARYGYDKQAGAGPQAKPARPELSDSAMLVLNGVRSGESVQNRPDPVSHEEAEKTDSGISVGGKKVPPGGCGREGYRRLYAPTKDSVDLLFGFGLSSEALDRSKNDSRVRDVVAKWSACMAEAGYAGIETPYDVVEKLGLAGDKGGPRAVVVAVKDVACKREVNLVGVWAAVETAYQNQLVDEHAETLALYKKQRDARFELAASMS